MHIKDKRGKMPDKNNNAKGKKPSVKDFPTLKFVSERDIAMDFATKVYEKFSKMIKSIVLFGSQVKQTAQASSDIDVIISLISSMLLLANFILVLSIKL